MVSSPLGRLRTSLRLGAPNPVSSPFLMLDPTHFPARRHVLPEERYDMIGTVKWFNAQKGYGFIQPENGEKDTFVHISAVEQSGMNDLREGQKVSYEIERGQQGKTSAVRLELA
jgi:cold shock protein